MTDRTELPPLTPTEERMFRVARGWAAERRTSEQGRPVLESRLIDLVRRMSAVRQPARRPTDRDVRPAQPSSRTPAAGAPVRNRPAVNNMPEVLPDAPGEAAGGRECDAVECGESSVGWRFYRTLGWMATCTRHMSGAGSAIRRMDAEQRVAFGPGVPATTEGPVCPSAASDDGMRARGASGPERPAEGPFWPIDSAPSAEASPATTPEDAPGAPAAPSGPSGRPQTPAGDTEPYSATAGIEGAQR